jgi:hypothetical protein
MNKKNRMAGRQTPLLAVILVMAVLIPATAVNAGPSWRGDPNTTVEQWSFGDSGTSPSPDTGFPPNPYGTPQTWIVNNAVWNPGPIDSHIGVWQLGTGEIDIYIPNNPVAQFQKDIWVELVWKGINLTFRPEQPMLGIYPDGGYTQLNSTREDTSESGWTSSVFKISVWPNPPSEWITISGDIYVDQVVIDTRCIPEPIPEPATFGLLIGGAFMAIRRGRKIKD